MPLPESLQEVQEHDIQHAFQKHLESMGELQTLVGGKIAPLTAAQDLPLDRVDYQIVGDEPVGQLKGETSARIATIHLRCWAATPGKAATIARSIAGRRSDPRLAGYIGFMGDMIHVAFVKVSDRSEDVEVPTSGEEAGEFWKLLVITIQYYDPQTTGRE